MRLSLRLMAVLAFVLPFVLPQNAHADTYQIFRLSSSQYDGPIGFDDRGYAVLGRGSDCSSGDRTDHCYSVFFNGKFEYDTPYMPNYTFDNGTVCTPSIPGGYSLYAVCNAGEFAFNGYAVYPPPPIPQRPAIYIGDPLQFFAYGGGSTLFFLNGLHDVLWEGRVYRLRV